MSEIIKDGGGRGYSAKVNSQGMLNTISTTHPLSAHRSDLGTSFGLSTGILDIGTTGGRVLYLKNTAVGTDIHIETIFLSWNGGSTNHNRAMEASLSFGDSTPTANMVEVIPGVLNRRFNNTPEGEFYRWDGVGDAMVTSGGEETFRGFCSQGQTIIKLEGVLMLGSQDSLSIELNGEEAGKASVDVVFYTDVSGGTH